MVLMVPVLTDWYQRKQRRTCWFIFSFRDPLLMCLWGGFTLDRSEELNSLFCSFLLNHWRLIVFISAEYFKLFFLQKSLKYNLNSQKSSDIKISGFYYETSAGSVVILSVSGISSNTTYLSFRIHHTRQHYSINQSNFIYKTPFRQIRIQFKEIRRKQRSSNE